jgi:GTP-dependent phosphoenolpyruvate carboxykinase
MSESQFVEETTKQQMASSEEHHQNPKFHKWVEECKRMCAPSSVHYCNGSVEEYEMLTKKLVESGTLIPLNPEIRYAIDFI